MISKKFGYFAVSLLLTLTLAACGAVPENPDYNAPKEEITLSETEKTITAKELPEEITPEKVTDKAPNSDKSQSGETEKTEVTPEESSQTAEEKITSTAAAANSSENTSPATTDNTESTVLTVPFVSEPNVTLSTPEITESTTAETQANTLDTTVPRKNEYPESTLPETEPEESETTTTEPIPPQTAEITEPALTGGAYGQRFCTEAESEFAQRVFELTNIERAKEGLPAFEKMDILKNVALTRAWELTVEYRGDHTRPDGSICTGAFNENGLIYGGWAENIAAGQDTPEGVVEAWMNSPSHRAAILNEDYTYLGVGYYYIKDDYQSYYHFWTQEFYHY